MEIIKFILTLCKANNQSKILSVASSFFVVQNKNLVVQIRQLILQGFQNQYVLISISHHCKTFLLKVSAYRNMQDKLRSSCFMHTTPTASHYPYKNLKIVTPHKYLPGHKNLIITAPPIAFINLFLAGLYHIRAESKWTTQLRGQYAQQLIGPDWY